jgi:dipeptidyl aminopeptidase/acylaminoacyl peptidase
MWDTTPLNHSAFMLPGVNFFFALKFFFPTPRTGKIMLRYPFVLSLALTSVFAPFCSAQAGSVAAQPKRPMTFEDMMKMKRLGDTAVSPDGKWLAYSVTTVDLNQNEKKTELWLQAIAGGEPLKLAVAQPGDNGLQFAPNGRSVLFLSDRSGSQQVWLADFDPTTGATSNPKQLTSIATEANNAIWSPDSRSIVFTSSVYPDCPAITAADAATTGVPTDRSSSVGWSTGEKCNAERDANLTASKVKAQIFTHLLYRHWDHFTGEKRSHLFLLSVETGALRDLTPNDPHDVPPFSLDGGGGGFAFSPDAKELAFTENLDPEPAASTSVSIFTLDLTDPAAKPVKISTSAGGNFNPAYSPDGKYLAWRSQERAGYESDKFRLVLYDRAAKTSNDLLPKFDNWVNEFAWGPAKSSVICFTAGIAGEETVFALSVLDGKPNNLPAFLTSGGSYSDLHITPDGKKLIATRNSVQSPSEVVALETDWLGHTSFDATYHLNSIKHGKLVSSSYEPIADDQILSKTQLTHLNDALLAQLDRPAMESFWFEAADKTKLQGFLIRPPAFDPAKKYPVKFLIHGGPQGAWGDDWSYRWNPELFAANGYVVVMINPRGSTGYGQKIVDGVNGDWGGKPFTDLMEGLDYAEQHYSFIDKNREAALGASYGGFMANWILGHTDRFRCIVTHDGMFNPESAYGSTEELWFNEWEFKGKPWDYYGKPDAENPFRKWSPALSAKNFKTPTLVIHGQLDYRLDVSEGFQLFTTLQRLKVPSKMLYFPDEGHWVLKPQNSQLWYKTVNDWVDQWTK